jgi:hypothetical protein
MGSSDNNTRIVSRKVEKQFSRKVWESRTLTYIEKVLVEIADNTIVDEKILETSVKEDTGWTSDDTSKGKLDHLVYELMDGRTLFEAEDCEYGPHNWSFDLLLEEDEDDEDQRAIEADIIHGRVE